MPCNRVLAGCAVPGIVELAGEAALSRGLALLPGYARGGGRRGDSVPGGVNWSTRPTAPIALFGVGRWLDHQR